MAGKERTIGASKEAEASAVPAGRVSETDTGVEGGGPLSERDRGGRARWGRGVRLYVLVVGVVGAATAVRWMLDPLFGWSKEFITFYPAIAVAALVGGARAGLMATVLSALAVDLLFQEPRGSLKVESLGDWVALGLFVVAGGLMSWMAEKVERARRREGEAIGLAQAAEALEESHRRTTETLESISDAFFSLDNQLVVTYYNRAAEEVLGRKRELVLGRPLFEVFPEAKGSIFEEKYTESLKERKAQAFETYFGVAPFKNWYDVRVYPQPGGISVYFRLTTERKHAEEALRESEERLARGVEVAGIGLFEHDHQREVLEWSPEMRRIFGVGESEAVTMAGFLERVLPEDREGLVKTIRRAHDPAGDGRFEVEYRVLHGGGQVRWVSVRAQSCFEGEGSERRLVRTIGAVLDVTERKNAQAELERLVAERTGRLQEMVGELEHFSYTITHDLKAPLRAMRGFAEITRDLCRSCGPPEALVALGKISTAAERMDGLIADALSYSRAVRQDLPLTDVDTAALLRGMLETYPDLQPSRAHIQMENGLPVVLGNEAGLTQCFSNLLGNAVKFVRPGEKPEVRVWAQQMQNEERTMKNPGGSGWVRIWVEDKGIGISTEMLPRVFDMFSRGSKEYEGTGIGLALVRKVAQRMGGRVGVESEEGRGSRFWMELKVGERRPEPAQWQVAATGARGGTVLYVEDEESDAMFMQTAFTEKGLGSALRVVGDGRAAIEYLSGAGKYADRKEYPLPSVVLLDLNLPQVPGFGVVKWMRNHPDFARTPVVVFSSSTREDDRVKALELGANEFVSKPSSGLEFGQVVGRLRAKWIGGGGQRLT